MACALTTGRKVPCKKGFGGIKTIYMADFPVTATIDVDQTISAFSASPDWYQWDVKGNSSLETAITSSRENGTTFYTQTINITYLILTMQQKMRLR